MRIALISDIHGNYVALQAVLADIKTAGVDQTICLGDLATLGPQPGEVVSLMRSSKCLHVMGNHDDYLLNQELSKEYQSASWFQDNVAWCRQQLNDTDLSAMKSSGTNTMEVALSDYMMLLCVHGSPRSNTDILLATTSDALLEEMLNGRRATVIAGGHTHIQMVRQYKGMMLVNAGSVGMPFEEAVYPAKAPRYLPWAEYAIVTHDKGNLHIDLRRVHVDMEKVKQAALASTMPDKHNWANNWLRSNGHPGTFV